MLGSAEATSAIHRPQSPEISHGERRRYLSLQSSLQMRSRYLGTNGSILPGIYGAAPPVRDDAMDVQSQLRMHTAPGTAFETRCVRR